MQLAVGIDRAVFLPDCDDCFDSVLPSCVMAAIALRSAHRPQPEVSTQTPA